MLWCRFAGCCSSACFGFGCQSGCLPLVLPSLLITVFFCFFRGIAVCSSTLFIVVGMRVGLHVLANCEHVLVR